MTLKYLPVPCIKSLPHFSLSVPALCGSDFYTLTSRTKLTLLFCIHLTTGKATMSLDAEHALISL